jgi:WD40 repeat protein
MKDHHVGYVYYAAFGPNDGQLAITTSDDNTAKLWEVESGKLLHTLDKHTSLISNAIFSPDSQLVVTNSYDGTGRVWNTNTGENIFVMTVSPDIRVTQADFSHDGKWIITAFSDGTARRWQMFRVDYFELIGHANPVKNAGFNRDGTKVVTTSKEAVYLWDAQSGQQLYRFTGHTDWITSADFSWDSKYVLTTACCSDQTTRVWDINSGEQLYILNDARRKDFDDLDDPNNKIRISPARKVDSTEDPNSSTTSTFDTTFIWNTKENKLLHQFEGDFAGISSDGERMLTISNNKLILWQAETQEPLWSEGW